MLAWTIIRVEFKGFLFFCEKIKIKHWEIFNLSSLSTINPVHQCTTKFTKLGQQKPFKDA